jgi:methionyl-tRNA formyltransferase
MIITVFCSSAGHPVYPYLVDWSERRGGIHLTTDIDDLKGGDILFLLSVNEIISEKVLNKYNRSYVLHASDLPKGRGWSPHIWEILGGADEITVSLFEAKGKVDSGDIYGQEKIRLDGSELYDEINERLFNAELRLMESAIADHPLEGRPQVGEPTFYKKRQPEDSQLDPYKNIISQFNLLRVADYYRFPAYFIIGSQRYNIKLEKINKEEDKHGK